MWLVPNQYNNHHPHLLRLPGLACIALILLGLQFLYNVRTTGVSQILGYATNVSSQAITADINNARLEQNLAPLQTDQNLNVAASLKANDMLQRDYWSHNAPDGTQPWQWFKLAGYSYTYAGENLAKDFNTSAGVTNAWMHSPTHRDNMLGSHYTHVGVAVVNGTLHNNQTTLVVALFGAPAPQTDDLDHAASVATTAAAASGSTIFTNPARIDIIFNPLSLLTLTILLSVFAVAALTHWHYIKLPKKLRKSWYQHHALYTALIALLSIGYIVYILTSGTI